MGALATASPTHSPTGPVAKRTKDVGMSLLVGKYVNKIDRKGRVSVPKQFRDGLAAQATTFAGVYAFPLFKSPALQICGEAFMRQLTRSIDRLDFFSDDQDDMASIVLESAHALAFDPEGRVTFPRELMDHAQLTSEALFVGRGTACRVWSPELHRKQHGQAFERARSRSATLRVDFTGSELE
jgi:MraZ protein